MTQHHGTTGRIIPVERLQPGDHSCMDVTDRASRWQVLTAFTRTGLARGEKVMLLLDPSDLNDEDAVACLDGGTGHMEAALKSGQFVLDRNTSAYLPDGRFSKERQVRDFAAEAERAREAGYPRLRGAGDMGWAPRAGVADDEVIDYEASLAELFADGYLTALCCYDRQQCGDPLVAATRTVHPLQVMECLGGLEVTRAPGGGRRIAGSAELGSREEFTRALREALGPRPGRGSSRYELDLTDLVYMEAHCAWQLLDLVAGLPRKDTAVVRCGPMPATALRGLGSADVPQLELHVADPQDTQDTGDTAEAEDVA
ncbi:MEDS domain-containing protein [Streptomyces ochraceiscleroticus]|uniref:MEDS domain-containing protein n=1 Tax=Streptomyces ochraceiscleroticus TaxID=47761 RepID=A0ABW1MJ74_9ACTN|nr:MEDS domain-containing protein [Streptomyces ochraceiscleroticus]